MSVSIHPVFDPEVLDAPHVEGKALMLAEMTMLLPDLADRLGLTPLIDFGDAKFPGSPTWHPAVDGLTSVRGLLAAIRDDPEALDDPDGMLDMIQPGMDVDELRDWLLGDLADLERGLELAEASGSRFHLHWSV